MNTGNTENYCRTLINGGGRLRHIVHLVMMIVDGLRLLRRPVTSTGAISAAVAVFARFVSFPLQSLNLMKMMNNGGK